MAVGGALPRKTMAEKAASHSVTVEINLDIFQRHGTRPVQLSYLTFLVGIRQSIFYLFIVKTVLNMDV